MCTGFGEDGADNSANEDGENFTLCLLHGCPIAITSEEEKDTKEISPKMAIPLDQYAHTKVCMMIVNFAVWPTACLLR